MANPHGLPFPPLTANQKDAALAWFHSKAGQHPKCHLCKAGSFTVADYLSVPPVSSGQGASFGPMAYPQYMIICDDCGNTLFIDTSRPDCGIVKCPEAQR